MSRLLLCTLFLSILITGIYGYMYQDPFVHSERDRASGRQVYIAEGCIHCHSQYSRPDTIDTALWGPATPPSLNSGEPVLFGNRRQGPDLSNIGFRRSREWNKIHLADPSSLVPGSRMPAYRHLFDGSLESKGEALLDYLSELQASELDRWIRHISEWRPQGDLFSGDPGKGSQAYLNSCAQCHGADGQGGGPLSGQFASSPRNLVSGEFLYAPDSLGSGQQAARLAQIIKYGQAGTSMPGHETFSDKEIIDLLAYLRSIREK